MAAPQFVILAEAEISGGKGARYSPEIPAFAGMTEEVGGR